MNFKAEVFESDKITIAIQGPKSRQLMNKIFGQDIDQLKYFTFKKYFFNKDNEVLFLEINSVCTRKTKSDF